jgi:pimeloyl-ACP methyl ester carboxylesterase
MKQQRRVLFALLLALLAAPSAAWAQAPAAAPAKEAVVFGQKIRYNDAGSGPVVVLPHGLGGNAANWAFNAPALAQKYRVIAPDQVGFGNSDKPLINYRVGTYVDFLDKFLAGLKVERATLAGNSMGGWIAAAYALKYPSKVERLGLLLGWRWAFFLLGFPGLCGAALLERRGGAAGGELLSARAVSDVARRGGGGRARHRGAAVARLRRRHLLLRRQPRRVRHRRAARRPHQRRARRGPKPAGYALRPAALSRGLSARRAAALAGGRKLETSRR